jgi:hypothetical protein
MIILPIGHQLGHQEPSLSSKKPCRDPFHIASPETKETWNPKTPLEMMDAPWECWVHASFCRAPWKHTYIYNYIYTLTYTYVWITKYIHISSFIIYWYEYGQIKSAIERQPIPQRLNTNFLIGGLWNDYNSCKTNDNFCQTKLPVSFRDDFPGETIGFQINVILPYDSQLF